MMHIKDLVGSCFSYTLFRYFCASLLFIFASNTATMPVWGAEFYVDPVDGSMSNDGTQANPWSTLQAVFEQNKIESQKWEDHPYVPGMALVPKNPGAPVKAGDTIVLMNGYHGKLDISEYYNAAYITVTAMAGHKPALSLSEISSGCKWILNGLTFSPELAPQYETGYLLKFVDHNYTGPCYDYIVEDCLLYSVWDSSSWSQSDWNDKTCSGIMLAGTQMVLRNCHVKNVSMGIYITDDGAECLVENSTVENFSGDGMRCLGDNCTFQYNIVKNSYDVNGNHDDGFQSWSLGTGGVGSGTVYGMVLRGNTIIAYEDPAQPFRGTLQGIGCFDGMFEDWIVENNVVITDHWHGITLLGAVNCRVVNNTVIDINSTSPGPPWIRIAEHKDGTPCSGCLVRNNLVTALNNETQGIQVDNNIIVENYSDFFIDAAARDLRLKAGCTAIDSGKADQSPLVDRDQNSRPAGPGMDVGAYEFVSLSGSDSD